MSSSALLWTGIAAAICWFFAINLAYALWKLLRDRSFVRTWSVVQGRITISRAGASPTHPTGGDPADVGAILRYHYRVGDKDYEGDGFKIGGKSRAMGLIAKALLKKYPEGRPVDVYYDPADPAKSALDEKGKGSVPGTVIFLMVFTTIAGILTAHWLAGKMLMMSNGLPLFTLILPVAFILLGIALIAAFFVNRRERKAAAAWPTTRGRITMSQVIEKVERETDDDGDEREDTIYQPEIRFEYRVDGGAYSSNTWKPGGAVGTGSPKFAESIVARYPVGQSVAVHYDPKHPDHAVLEPDNRAGATAPLVAGLAFGLAGTLFMWVMTHGHWVNAATGS